jgi:type IV secretory pathway VirB10-like protein
MNPVNERSDDLRPLDKADPLETLALHGTRPAVTRINPRAVVLALVLVAAVGGLGLIVGLGSYHRRADTEREQNLIRPSEQVVQNNVGALPADYSFDVRKELEGVGYERNVRPSPASRPVATPATAPSAAELAAERERQRRLEALRAEWEKALDSPVVFASSRQRAATAVAETTTTPPTHAADGRGMAGSESSGHAAGRSTGAELSPAGGAAAAIAMAGGDPNAAQPPGVRTNLQNEKERFFTEAGKVEPYLHKPLIGTLSKFEVKAGTLIPGALLTAINTDLPGEVIAQVTENVYDTASGDHLLIPEGSRLLGKYQSLVSNGQNRALLVWSRVIFPNGKSVVLDGMPGTDQLGQAGLKDQVDYHLDRIGGAVALSTAIAYGGNLARGRNRGINAGDDGRDVIGDTVAQEAGRVGQRFVDRELDVQPTITIRSGWPLRVLVNKDIVLEPYVAQ